jgi:hypothetical protein
MKRTNAGGDLDRFSEVGSAQLRASPSGRGELIRYLHLPRPVRRSYRSRVSDSLRARELAGDCPVVLGLVRLACCRACQRCRGDAGAGEALKRRLRESIGLDHDWSFRWCAMAAGVRGGPGAPGKGKQVSNPTNANTFPSSVVTVCSERRGPGAVPVSGFRRLFTAIVDGSGLEVRECDVPLVSGESAGAGARCGCPGQDGCAGCVVRPLARAFWRQS